MAQGEEVDDDEEEFNEEEYDEGEDEGDLEEGDEGEEEKPPVFGEGSPVVQLDAESYANIEKSDKLHFVKYYIQECEPCRQMVPELEKAAESLEAYGVVVSVSLLVPPPLLPTHAPRTTVHRRAPPARRPSTLARTLRWPRARA